MPAGLRPRPVLRVEEARAKHEARDQQVAELDKRRADCKVTDENAGAAKPRPRDGRELRQVREPLREVRAEGKREVASLQFKPEVRQPARDSRRDSSKERPRPDYDVHRACVGTEGEYGDDIFAVALREEARHRPQRICEGDITPRMHSVLVDWLAEVHLKFQLRAESLFLAVSLLDRFLAQAEPPRSRLQLVGVTALFVASKYEEVFAPELRDFVFVTDRAYSRDDILQCEVLLLTTLKWRITVPSPMLFLHRFALLAGVSLVEDAFFLAQYFAELALPDVRFVKLAPSLIASAALLLANKVLKVSPSWPRAVAAAVSYQETEVKGLAKQLVELLGADSAVKRKFSTRAFRQVAKLIA